MKFKRSDLVVLVFNFEVSPITYRFLSYGSAIRKFIIALQKENTLCEIQSEKSKTGLHAVIGEGFSAELMKVHFKKEIPMGIFCVRDNHHLKMMTETVKKVYEEMEILV